MLRIVGAEGYSLFRHRLQSVGRNKLILATPVCKACQRLVSKATKPPVFKQVACSKDKIVISFLPAKSISSSPALVKSADDGGKKTVTKQSDDGGKKSKDKKADNQRPQGYYKYAGNIEITLDRAKNDYLLEDSDMVSLRKFKRRTPYNTATKGQIEMVLKQDAEKKALEKWGSQEALEKEQKRQFQILIERHGGIKSLLHPSPQQSIQWDTGDTYKKVGRFENLRKFLEDPTAKTVLLAISMNAINTVGKLVAWVWTGSGSMFAEAIHSGADTLNQAVIGIGLYLASKKPDHEHPYGYNNIRYISSLISGIGVFWLGVGLSGYHGVYGLLYPTQLEHIELGLSMLAFSFVTEAVSLRFAYRQAKKESKNRAISMREFIMEGHNPNLNVVLLEDFAAVLGVVVAGSAMSASWYLQLPWIDSCGSLGIGFILGTVSTLLVHTNSSRLLGKSTRDTKPISEDLEGDRMVRSVLDIKSTDMGDQSRYKAEVVFDGIQITLDYLKDVDLNLLLTEIKAVQTEEDVENFVAKIGDSIIDYVAINVDRVETNLKKKYPHLRHIDLEPI